VRAKIRLKINRCAKNKKSETKKWDIGQINTKEVQEEFIVEVAANVQSTQFKKVEYINEIWNKILKK
jgi:hypothetical protein